jgi:hypothetical protein
MNPPLFRLRAYELRQRGAEALRSRISRVTLEARASNSFWLLQSSPRVTSCWRLLIPMLVWSEPPLDLHQIEAFDDERLSSIPEQFQDLVKTNDFLEISQKSRLAQDVSLLEEHIQYLDELESYILKRKDHLKRCLFWRRLAISPVRSLPNDVLAEIFTIVVKSDASGRMGFTEHHFEEMHVTASNPQPNVPSLERDWGVYSDPMDKPGY